MFIGLDFGTTNSGAAAFDGEQLDLCALNPGSVNPAVIPSMLYVTREQETFIGQEAIDTYYRQNTQRPSKMVRYWVGEIEVTLSETTTIWPTAPGPLFRDVFVLVDEMRPGRLLRSLKSALATGYEGTMIFDRTYSLEELIAVYLREIRRRAEDELQTAVDGVVLGRPVQFADSSGPDQDERAQSRLRRAANLAGFQHVAFELEPVAAALHYEQSISEPQNVLVFDFGGGTLDITVMRIGTDAEREVLASDGFDTAGQAFDRRIIKHFLLDHFGQNTTWGKDSAPFPRAYFDALLHWETLPEMLRPETLEFLELAQRTSSHPHRIRALESLLVNALAPAMIESVEEAKMALSTDVFSAIRMVDEGIDIWQPLTRSQFEALIAATTRQVEARVLETVGRSGLRADEIDTVVRTGGSAQIPCFAAMLERLFGPEKVVLTDVFSSVASGLAIRAHTLEQQA